MSWLQVLGSSPLHTGAASRAGHHWYPDIDMMKQYEGKVVLYDEVPPDSLAAQAPKEFRYEQDWPDNWEKPFPEKFVR